MSRQSDFHVLSEVPIPGEGHSWARVVDVEVEEQASRQMVSKGPWTIVRDGDGVQVLPITFDDKVVLVVQRRIPVGVSRHKEIPQGKPGQGEDPAVAAERELLEETGYAAPNGLLRIYDFLNRFPSRSDQWLHLHVAYGVEQVGEISDRDEILDILIIPFDEAYEMIGKEDGLWEPATVIALQWEKIRRLEETAERHYRLQDSIARDVD